MYIYETSVLLTHSITDRSAPTGVRNENEQKRRKWWNVCALPWVLWQKPVRLQTVSEAKAYKREEEKSAEAGGSEEEDASKAAKSYRLGALSSW